MSGSAPDGDIAHGVGAVVVALIRQRPQQLVGPHQVPQRVAQLGRLVVQ